MCETQDMIDARRARGEKVPLAWITNPFHRRYYMEMGGAETPGEDAKP